MQNVIAFVKKHPVMIGVAVFVVGLIIVLAMVGGGGGQQEQVVSAQPVDNTASILGANAQIAIAQIQGQVATATVDAQKTVALQTSSDALAATRATLEMQNNANVLGAYAIVHGQDTAMNTAITTNKQNTDAAVAINQAQASAAISIAGINADAMKYQSSIDLQKTLANVTGGSAWGITGEQAYNLAQNKIASQEFSQSIDLQKLAVQKTGSVWGIAPDAASAIGITNAIKG